ncbi:hypothetical protein [Frankia sp. CiP3]|uniref:hypothetical protein n=1 Tax=Frankia sp. CiP3 TaxID=2880971 RepID=UPI001EF70798|nr:hypothetical protein [Frankia sp. CiP3]
MVLDDLVLSWPVLATNTTVGSCPGCCVAPSTAVRPWMCRHYAWLKSRQPVPPSLGTSPISIAAALTGAIDICGLSRIDHI